MAETEFLLYVAANSAGLVRGVVGWVDLASPGAVDTLTEAVRAARNVRVLSVSTLIGEAIARTAAEESVSSLFD